MEYYENYCLDCEWAASKKDHSTDELTSLVIEHSLTNEHDIESRYTPAPIETSHD